MARPYQKANIPGPEMGTSVFDPKVMVNLLKSPKKKVFVSFDFDNDKVLKDFIIGQSRLAD